MFTTRRANGFVRLRNGRMDRRRMSAYTWAALKYIEYVRNKVSLERETLHVMDDKRRIALVETKIVDSKWQVCNLPDVLIRYQFSDHLESSCLELDSEAKVVSYEEYYPYGGTSYEAVRRVVETSPKRYRYTGQERDEETGFYYNGARYYVPWLGRWTAPDPKAPVVKQPLVAA